MENQPSNATSSAADSLFEKLTGTGKSNNVPTNNQAGSEAADAVLQKLKPAANPAPAPDPAPAADPAPAPDPAPAADPAPAPDPAPAADPAPAPDPAPAADPAPVPSEFDYMDPEFANSLNGDPAPSPDPNGPAAAAQNQLQNPKEKELTEKLQVLEQELESTKQVLSNPLVAALAEFVSAGNTDITSFVKEISEYDPGQMSVEQMYTDIAKGQGFEGDDLEAAVKEQMEEFSGLTMIKRKEEESRLREMFSGKANQKLTALREKIHNARVESDQHIKEVSDKAEATLNSSIDSLIGKSWKTIKVDADMASQVKQVVPMYSSLIAQRDNSGKLTGFDVQKGIELAMFDLYGATLLQNAFKYGKTQGYNEAMVERARPTAPPASASPAVPDSKTTQEKFKEAREEAARQTSGKRTLFSLGGGVTQK